jgi:hypothetical protein
MDSYIRRKLWEHKQQAVSVVNVYAEAMSGSKRQGKGNRRPQSSPAQREFRPNHGGVNFGPPPLAELSKLGFEVEM